ncbi:DEAD/DEAH box helicase [Mycolicibacillus parakoreensis]|uniref:DEAD/DEAH box helicase n=1 Tax=Mycolicibacillus parakoreensis TaxID=1069221 RepID=A0ABY3U0Y9_9MYCO|nr:helicase-related protein [Mycolicibacillus parakoreensis]MCV7316125.1 DEAD/DEAH box helicase [Mycolicibacillus parakoreensis]ULN52260.1 DEAD/DEAH box helicase [Mycolicibacillus parakoreensis]
MTSQASSVPEVSPSFGYHPDPEQPNVAFDRGEFPRALVLDGPVRELASFAGECRVLGQPEIELPEGIYWFQSIDGGALVMQVAHGALPGDATVTAVDQLTEHHPLMAAYGWAEKLWLDAHVVPPPRFAINEAAVTHPGDADIVIRDRVFLGGRSGQWSYTVIVEGHQQSVIESSLKARPELDDPRAWVTREPTPARRFGATLTRAKLQSKFANTLFSFRATRTTFRPYQFKPVLKLLQTGKARILIADEVGLGKTIEAGLIWTELEARREADKVLIVCPAGLVGKWKEEMDDRFEFDLTELDSSTLRTFLEKHRQNRLPRRQAYIGSIERLRTWAGMEELDELPPEFDLVIVDEAHSMRNQDTKSYALGTRLTDWADNLVFLTATPINLRQEDLLNLLELLAPGDYGDIRDLEMRLEPNRITNAVAARLVEKGVDGRELCSKLEELRTTALGAPLMQRPDFGFLAEILDKERLTPRDVVDAKRYLADLNTLSTVITRTKKIDVDDRKSKRTLHRYEVTWTPAETEFYTEYLEWCKDRAAAMGRPLHFAMQMPLRLASACLPMARRAVLDPQSFGAITDADSDAPAVRVEPHAGLVAAARRLPEDVDTKFDHLRQVLRTLQQQGRRALVFTHSRPTLAYLIGRLQAEFRIAVMHGGVNREKRRRIMADFRDGSYDFVLANRVASEGLDFEFCSAVVNYDLPWNPMEIEQRIGRIDRIGQLEETMLVVNFVNDATIDERILSRLLERIGIFESSIGALEPIIAANAPKVLEAGFDFTLTPEQRAQKIHEVETAIEEQRAGLQDVSDASSALLVSNDVDVAGLEDELIRTGRYIGQHELAQLLDDWARVDGASGIRLADDNRTAELYGNPVMAGRVDELAKTAQRTRAETSDLSTQLRSEIPISLVLDQELARTGGGKLLTATSPLAMAAAAVPGHRQARFASLRLSTATENVSPGIYVVVMAKAVSASPGGDEIWGAAVTESGRDAGEGPGNALLAALAEGRLADAPLPNIDRLERLAERAHNQLHRRHLEEQERRRHEFEGLRESRAISLEQQHSRKMAAIENRLATARHRKRGDRVIALFESQRRRAQERYSSLCADLRSEVQPEIRLEPLAACVIEIVA